MSDYAFSQVDVFSRAPVGGNPVAVVHDADALTASQMAAFARWTNLSETTFLLQPTDPAADYRLRIFTPGGELPFAGHPTLGSAHAWLQAKGLDVTATRSLVQQCAAGPVTLRVAGSRIAFAAPPLTRSGPVGDEDRERAVRSLGIAPEAVLCAQWVDNGPGWLGVLLRDAELVRAVQPDFAAMAPLKVGIIGTTGTEGRDEPRFEVRAFVPTLGVPEDPVTGSLNAGLAQWLIGAGIAPEHYVAAQGTCRDRDGRVHVDAEGDDVWIGGQCTRVVSGTVTL